MLKLGVWTREAFVLSPPKGLWQHLLYLLSRSRVSLQLLSLPAEPSSADIDVFERLMPHVQLSSGVYRTTYRLRFQSLDGHLNSLLRSSFPASAHLRIEDWAASGCLTSSEWAQTLFLLFPNC